MAHNSILIEAAYSSGANDHRSYYSCDWFEITGTANFSDEVESLPILDDCPSQGVDDVIDSVIRDLRYRLVEGDTYNIIVRVDGSLPGHGQKFFTASRLNIALLLKDAGDLEEE